MLQRDALEAALCDSIAQRLCALISVLAPRQHCNRQTADSVKTIGLRIAAVLQQVLTSAYGRETRSAALEASGAWIKLMVDTGSKCPEFLSTCLQAVEHGFDETALVSVSAEASLRFCVALGPLLPSPGAVVVAGLESCARQPRPDLLRVRSSSFQGLAWSLLCGSTFAQALAALVASTQCLSPSPLLTLHA